MNRLQAGLITTGIGAVLLCSGAITETIRSDQLHSPTETLMWENYSQDLRNKLTRSWSEGLEAIHKVMGEGEDEDKENLSKWKLYYDLEHAKHQIPRKEHSSFIHVYYGEARRSLLENGDVMPALLLNPDHSKAIQFWEKHDGTYAIITMEKRLDEDGSRRWLESGAQIINKP
ncbi:hypothetical protein [Paenibacillus sp. 7523-1]|uniref:hypothetical protein n=1 Tax=Paenibacillus sp. 7523-1 TaxID=2022550 RepID=UPI000BA598A7|nr:hypothetical protein [Paenibacillus sp. 7523-1]PAD29367.1 hypothetical protein CHH60_21955 [Paenibacillus sp. 7523-1]